MAQRQGLMIHSGTFERVGPDASPLDGEGSITLTPSGLRVQTFIVRSGLIAGLSGCLSLIAVAIVAVFLLEYVFRAGQSQRLGVAIGVATMVATFLGARALLSRLLPRRPFDRVIPFAYVVSSGLESGAVWIACSAPACAGRIRFRTQDQAGLVRAIAQAKQC